MVSHKRTYAVSGLLAVGVFAWLSVAPSEAADRLNRSIDSGKPRELINHPACWPPDHLDDAWYCEFAEKI